MALSPFEHTLLSGLFGDAELAGLFSEGAELDAMLRFEAALAEAQGELGLIPSEAATTIGRLCASFEPDTEQLRNGVAKDGVPVPNLIKQMRAALDEAAAPHLHFGATSQDVVDTGLVLRLAAVTKVLGARIAAIVELLRAHEQTFGPNRLMGRTRMQDALDIAVADRLRDWRLPLERDLDRLLEIKPRLLVLQLGGAVGTLEKFGPKGSEMAADVATRLGLAAPQKSWHNQRDSIVEFANWLALVTGSLGKIGQDAAIMAQNARGEIRLAGGGGSSAMPHKSNPVAAEVLVSLARYNAGMSGTMAQSLVHEQERSGAAWTLEWLVLPQMVMATGSALLLGQRLLDSIEALGEPG
jgi:3-carboxy-cis,cis-muconate cycloisomerase